MSNFAQFGCCPGSLSCPLIWRLMEGTSLQLAIVHSFLVHKLAEVWGVELVDCRIVGRDLDMQ